MTNILIVMDPPETVHPDKDTSFALGEAARNKGMDTYYAPVESLFLNDGTPHIRCQPCSFIRDAKQPIRFLAPPIQHELDWFDFVLMRKDPPYDMNYIVATHILGMAKKATVINNPIGLREAPEKIYPLRFPGIFPPTLISRNVQNLVSFANLHSEFILKPLDGNGGRGVVKSSTSDRNFLSLCELLTQQETEYVIIQTYLPEIANGDKRIILLDGDPVGSVLRVPPPSDNRANFHVGAAAVKSTLTKKDRELCDAIGPSLKADGLYFVGIDIIGDRITEINVTSPTGIQEIKQFDGIDIAVMFWERLGL